MPGFERPLVHLRWVYAHDMPRSSSGPGQRTFDPQAGVRFPYRVFEASNGNGSLTTDSVHVRDVARTLNRPAMVRAAAPAREIDERRTGDRRSSVVPPAMEPVDNRVGAGSYQATEGVSRCPASGMLPERPRIQCGYRGTYQQARRL